MNNAARNNTPMKIRVVIADDFPLVSEGIARALSLDPAIEVVGRGVNGREALDLGRRLSPDVMVLDLRMPDLGGIDVIRELAPEQPAIRFIVMTASEQVSELRDAVAAGAVGYLSKRTDGEGLRAAVITAYGGGSLMSPLLAGEMLNEFSCGGRGTQPRVRSLLAERELDVLRQVVQGKTDAEIAAALGISPHTVHNHLTRIREKTGLRRRAELTRWAVQHAVD